MSTIYIGKEARVNDQLKTAFEALQKDKKLVLPVGIKKPIDVVQTSVNARPKEPKGN